MPADINVRSRYRSSGDINQRHNGTFVGLKDEQTGEITPHYCIGVDGSFPERSSLVLDGRNDFTLTKRLTDPLLITDRPELGLANLEINGVKRAFMIYGVAARQYKRSFSWDYVRHECINDRDFRIEGTRSRLEVLKQFYNDTYPTYPQALESIKDPRAKSVAFSRRFCLSNTGRGILLVYERQAVGYINNDDEPVLLNPYIHLQEQLDEDK